MRTRKHPIHIVRLLCITSFLGAVAWTGCDSGGGGGSSPATGPQLAPESGKVAVLIADGPADEYEKILVTITEVSLIPEGKGKKPVVLFQSDDGLEVDLLELRNEDFVLTVREDVPPGRYSKIRVRIRSVRPIGGPCAELEVKLPSGKIDLNPRGGFEVVRGSTLFVRIDIDADKSISLHAAGRSGRCIFRPVVFVDIRAAAPERRCPKVVSGVIEAILVTRDDSPEDDPDDGDLDEVEAPEEGERVAGFVVDLRGRRGRLRVILEEGVRIFAEDGSPADTSALEIGAKVEIRGRLDHRGRLRASLVAVGELLSLSGRALGPVEDGRFALEADPEEELTGTIAVALTDATLLLAGCDQETTAGAIREGVRLRAIGKLIGEEGESGAFLRAVAVILEPGPVLEGRLVAFAQGETTLALTIETGDGEVTVTVPQGVPLLLEGDGEVALELLAGLLSCESRPIRVRLAAAGLLEAASVELLADRTSGIVSAVDREARTVELADGRVLGVLEDATILDVRSDDDRLIPLDAVAPGDRVTAFGLRACPEDAEDLVAFVLLVAADIELEDDLTTTTDLTPTPTPTPTPGGDDGDHVEEEHGEGAR